MSPRRSTQRHEFLRTIRFFCRMYRGCWNCIFPSKTLLWTNVFDLVWGNIFCRLFSRCLFFLGQGEKYTGKRLIETQSMKTWVKSGEIPVRINIGKMKQNVDSRRLTYKSAKLTCYSILKNSLRARDGFIQPIFYKRFYCFSL